MAPLRCKPGPGALALALALLLSGTALAAAACTSDSAYVGVEGDLTEMEHSVSSAGTRCCWCTSGLACGRAGTRQDRAFCNPTALQLPPGAVAHCLRLRLPCQTALPPHKPQQQQLPPAKGRYQRPRQ